jgi:hypothetical protein
MSNPLRIYCARYLEPTNSIYNQQHSHYMTEAHPALVAIIHGRSYWIPGSYAPALSEKRNSFLRPLKNKGFKKESMTKVGLYAISKSTTLESNKSHG